MTRVRAEGRRLSLQVGTASAGAVLAIITAAAAASRPRNVLLRGAGHADTDVRDPDARVGFIAVKSAASAGTTLSIHLPDANAVS